MADAAAVAADVYDKYEAAYMATADLLLEHGSIAFLHCALEDFFLPVVHNSASVTLYSAFIGDVAQHIRCMADDECDCDTTLVRALGEEIGAYSTVPRRPAFEQYFLFHACVGHAGDLLDLFSLVAGAAHETWPGVHWTFANLSDWPQDGDCCVAALWVVRNTFGWDYPHNMWPRDDVTHFWMIQSNGADLAVLEGAVRAGALLFDEMPPLQLPTAAPRSPPRTNVPRATTCVTPPM